MLYKECSCLVRSTHLYQGGFSYVFLAKDNHNKHYALKRVLIHDEEELQHVQQEAAVMVLITCFSFISFPHFNNKKLSFISIPHSHHKNTINTLFLRVGGFSHLLCSVHSMMCQYTDLCTFRNNYQKVSTKT